MTCWSILKKVYFLLTWVFRETPGDERPSSRGKATVLGVYEFVFYKYKDL